MSIILIVTTSKLFYFTEAVVPTIKLKIKISISERERETEFSLHNSYFMVPRKKALSLEKDD